MHIVTLACHPTTPCEAVCHISAHVRASATGVLTLEYSLDGDVGQLRIPAEGAPRRADKLWRHTCFEAFIAAPGAPGYYECNFAPFGEWAMYQFDAYREGMTPIEAAPPIITTHRTAHDLVVKVVVDLSVLHNFKDYPEVRLALSAVIENSNGELSYWALAHPPGKPDFHHADGFALTLNPLKNFA